MDKAFDSLTFENAAGKRVILSSQNISQYWELRGRSGFTAPDVKLITEKYVNGNERIVNRIVSPRTVRINMIVTGKTTAICDRIFFDMVDVLMDTSKGEVGKLYVTRSDGRVVILNCAYSGGMNIKEEYTNFHRFTLEFYASDPWFYTLPIKQTVEFGGESSAITLSETLYLGSWRLGWGKTNGVALVENRTGAPAEPIYEIAGSRSDLSIRNHSSREGIKFKDMDMDGDETLVIDTRSRYKSAYFRHADGSVSTALGYLVWSAVNLSLPMPEGQSYISVETTGEIEPLEITIMTASLSA